jgi:hypothetical protein
MIFFGNTEEETRAINESFRGDGIENLTELEEKQ